MISNYKMHNVDQDVIRTGDSLTTLLCALSDWPPGSLQSCVLIKIINHVQGVGTCGFEPHIIQMKTNFENHVNSLSKDGYISFS